DADGRQRLRRDFGPRNCRGCGSARQARVAEALCRARAGAHDRARVAQDIAAPPRFRRAGRGGQARGSEIEAVRAPRFGLWRRARRDVKLTQHRGASPMPIIDSQVHAYEANTPKRPWHTVPNWPDHVTGDEMVAAMDKVGVDGAIF